MAAHKYIDRICLAGALLSLLLTLLFMNGQALGVQPASRVMGYEAKLFDTSQVHTIDIVMDDWEQFIEICENEEYALCAVVIDNEAYQSIGIRAKGNTSLSTVSQMGSDRYSFKLEFDHYDKGKSYHGLDKLCLNNLIQDNTMMKDYLTYRMMGEFGAKAPLCSYVYLTVNGEDWGLYLAVEGVEDAFLQRNYGRDHGELYKPDSMSFGGGRGNGRDFDMDEFMNRDDGEQADGASGSTQPPKQQGAAPEGFTPPSFGGQFPETGGSGDAPQGGFDPWERFGGGPGGGFGGMGDIFSTFFGGAAAGGGRAVRKDGRDMGVGIRISLKEAATGEKKEIVYDRLAPCADCDGTGLGEGGKEVPCEECHGTGRVVTVQHTFLGDMQSATTCPECHGTGTIIENPCPECEGQGRVPDRQRVSVEVPRGIRDGQQLRIHGFGEAGMQGAAAGDLIVTVRIAPDEFFERDGDNLHCKLVVPMVQAALGADIEIDGIYEDEKVTVKIPEGCQNDQVVRVKGFGMPRLKSDVRGDLFAHIDVEIPTKLSKRERELLEELAAEISVRIAGEIAPYTDGLYLMTPFRRVALMARILERLAH